MSAPAIPSEVQAAFAAFPPAAQAVLGLVRGLIYRVAEATPGASPLTEALRWGQPAYLAPKGSTIRLGLTKSGEAALFVHCRTTLIDDFRPIAPPGTRFEGRRAVLFGPDDEIDPEALALLIRKALTWHR